MLFEVAVNAAQQLDLDDWVPGPLPPVSTTVPTMPPWLQPLWDEWGTTVVVVLGALTVIGWLTKLAGKYLSEETKNNIGTFIFLILVTGWLCYCAVDPEKLNAPISSWSMSDFLWYAWIGWYLVSLWNNWRNERNERRAAEMRMKKWWDEEGQWLR
jgi:hypothetical protein